MNAVEKYQELKDKLDRLATKKSRAEGRLEQIQQTLAKEFDCESIEEAKKLLKKKQAEAKEAEENFTQAVEEFEDQWGDILNGDS